MATLRALPSISSLLNHPPQNFASRANPSLHLPKHVRISCVRRNVRQIKGLGRVFADEERISESSTDEATVSEIFTDEARISEIFAEEVRVSDSFPDEVQVSGFFGAGFLERFVNEHIQGLGNERRISVRFANEERFGKVFGAGFLEKLVNKATSFTHEARISRRSVGFLEKFVRENARELAIVSLVLALVCLPEERALANGGGPVMEEFWDNVRRYGFYFFTVVSGAIYSLTKPVLDLLRDPSTQVLVLVVVLGVFYLLYLTVSTMLGLNEFQYEYAQ